MRVIPLFLLAGTAFQATPAVAADALKFGPSPRWVVAQAIPAAPASAKDRPVAILLHDQQTMLKPGAITTYSELAFKIQKPEGLAAGNLSIGWSPGTDTTTVNKLEIHRGDQTIDVLKSGQTFTTIRRESNLESAMLDGMLTANIQPEGLREGDIVVLATTTEHADPVLKGHVETIFAPWGEAQIALAHARLLWPSNVPLKLQKTGALPAPLQATSEGFKIYELTMRNADPVIAPKEAPLRFKIGRMGEATDFQSWGQAAALFAPLYNEAAVVPAAGPLRDEVEKIRKASADPKVRAEQALQLVQGRVRYVALLMGQGGYVPTAAETTWSRRFGDCKAKTALLLAILHDLGITAEPVAVSPVLGDAIGERLPSIGLFNHVLARAHINGKDYWLDGTRTGDNRLDDIEVPDFGWGLPLISGGQLVQMVPAALTTPSLERHVGIDASSGLYAPAAVTIDVVYRGDSAVQLNQLYSALAADQRDQQMDRLAKTYFDAFDRSASSLQFDKYKRELRIAIKGTAKLTWRDGWFYVPTSSVGFNPDFDRPAGPLHDVPLAVTHPRYVKDEATVRLPPEAIAQQQKLSSPVHQTLAGVEYARTESVSGDVVTVVSSERSLVAEVPYKDATVAAARLKALSNDDVYLKVPSSYRLSSADLPTRTAETLTTASEYFERGLQFLKSGQYDRAIADFGQAQQLDPKDAWSFSNRAMAYAHKGDDDAARKDIASAEALDPTNPVAARARGLIAETAGDFKGAIAAYSASLQRDPKNTWALQRRAFARHEAGDDDGALADTELALKSAPTSTDIRILRANIFMQQGKRDLVAAEASAMTSNSPTSDYAWVGAGKTYAALGQNDRALKAFDRALAIKPFAYIYLNRSAVRPRSDVKARTADLDAALKLEPTNSDVLQEKARLISEIGDFNGALALLDRVKPNANGAYAVDWQQQRAVALYKAGRTTEAEKLFADIRANAERPTDFNSICWGKATAGILLKSALQDCRDALKLKPDNGAYLDSLGMVLLRLGKLDEALEAYNQAVAKGTGANSLMGRAIVYLRRGDRAHAEADAAAARKLYAEIDAVFAGYGLKYESISATPAAVSHQGPTTRR